MLGNHCCEFQTLWKENKKFLSSQLITNSISTGAVLPTRGHWECAGVFLVVLATRALRSFNRVVSQGC